MHIVRCFSVERDRAKVCVRDFDRRGNQKSWTSYIHRYFQRDIATARHCEAIGQLDGYRATVIRLHIIQRGLVSVTPGMTTSLKNQRIPIGPVLNDDIESKIGSYSRSG